MSKKPIAKIVSKEEAFWTEVKENTEADINRLKRLLKLQEAIYSMCETHIFLSKEKKKDK